MRHTTYPVRGMHCRSCELLLERELARVAGVQTVRADARRGTVLIGMQHRVDDSEIESAVRNAGYQIGTAERTPWLTHDAEEYGLLLFAGILITMIALVARSLNIGSLSLASSVAGVMPSLLLGLTAGVSTCMALIGGLVLGMSARHAARHPEASAIERLRPHIFFHSGRVIGFALFGGVLGVVGSLVAPSSVLLGILTILVGVFMLLLGVQVTNLSPALSTMRLTIPSSIARTFGIHERHDREYSHRGAMLLGALTFFLPCGFTQIVQMAAVASGGPFLGAALMGAFALGTAPGLLGIGGIASLARGMTGRLVQKIAGVGVIVLAIVNIGNGFNLTGWTLPQRSPVSIADVADIQGGVQLLRMTQEAYGYSPNTFVVRRGIPVRWIIDSVEPRSCASSIRIPALGIGRELQRGENIIEFTPQQTGPLRFTCSMGMFSGTFTVIE